MGLQGKRVSKEWEECGWQAAVPDYKRRWESLLPCAERPERFLDWVEERKVANGRVTFCSPQECWRNAGGMLEEGCGNAVWRNKTRLLLAATM